MISIYCYSQTIITVKTMVKLPTYLIYESRDNLSVGSDV